MTGSTLLSIASGVWSAGLVVSPILIPYLTYRFTQGPTSYSSGIKFVAIFYATAFILRFLGRALSHDYRTFASQLISANWGEGQERRSAIDLLRAYDYQRVWLSPIDYEVQEPHPKRWYLPEESEDAVMQPLAEPLQSGRALLAWVAANTFGIRMLYPGSLGFLNSLLQPVFIKNRNNFLSTEGVQRQLLRTKEGNRIDSMFWDRRGTGSESGAILVICCEGNAGYYEGPGVVAAPVKLNYSVLGWNMPGFSESSGRPYPQEILNAMDAVMRFATEELGFQQQDIVLFSWSIGCFPATWAAANFPNVRALVIDAGFDDLLPLAQHRMPSAIRSLVHYTVRRHMNLHAAKQLAEYKGPLRLIRRWDDEMITTPHLSASPEETRASNRANYLLLDVIQRRYPGLLLTDEDKECVVEWLAMEPEERVQRFDHTHDPIVSAAPEEMEQGERKKLIRDVCSKLLVDFTSTHNIPINPLYFNIPTPIRVGTATKRE